MSKKKSVEPMTLTVTSMIDRMFQTETEMNRTIKILDASKMFSKFECRHYVNNGRTYLNMIAISPFKADFIKHQFPDAFDVVDGEKVSS